MNRIPVILTALLFRAERGQYMNGWQTEHGEWKIIFNMSNCEEPTVAAD